MVDIQEKLTHRALELLALPEGEPKLLLDIGCGSGLSGECLSDAGHLWVGSDISTAMLQVAVERDVSGARRGGLTPSMAQTGGECDAMRACRCPRPPVLQGLGYRAGTFDGAISISAVQWLCSAERSSHDPRARLRCVAWAGCCGRLDRAADARSGRRAAPRACGKGGEEAERRARVRGRCFFTSLYKVLARGARAVLQIYPDGHKQAEMITTAAMRAGFSGGLVVDYPNRCVAPLLAARRTA
eukprot:scaffold2547_cov299-Prasinococcus_capsulatus_cf.AAC.1